MSGKNANEVIGSKEVKAERKLDAIIRMREENLSFNITLAGQLEDVLRRLTGETWYISDDDDDVSPAEEVANELLPPAALDALSRLEEQSRQISIKIACIVEKLERI